MHPRLARSPRPALLRVSRLISYLYIPSGRELVSMIKKAPGEKRKFRAEYLTLSGSELCLENGREGGQKVGRGGRGQETRKKATTRHTERCKSTVAMLYTGYSAGDSFSRLCEFKGSSLP